MLMSIISGMFFITVFGMQKEVVLDVCVRVDKSTVLRRNDLPVQHLENYAQFTTKKPQPFEQYFRVKSAVYKDQFNNSGYVEVEKDLIKIQVPSAVCTVSLTNEEQKKLQFPLYVSRRFIEQVNKKELGLVTIGYNHENNVMLKLRYTIKEEQKKEPVTPALVTQSVQTMASTSSLLDYFHLITEALAALAVMR
jgi:hypothetical protein